MIYQQMKKMQLHFFKKRVFYRKHECVHLIIKQNCILEKKCCGHVALGIAIKRTTFMLAIGLLAGVFPLCVHYVFLVTGTDLSKIV